MELCTATREGHHLAKGMARPEHKIASSWFLSASPAVWHGTPLESGRDETETKTSSMNTTRKYSTMIKLKAAAFARACFCSSVGIISDGGGASFRLASLAEAGVLFCAQAMVAAAPRKRGRPRKECASAGALMLVFAGESKHKPGFPNDGA